MNTDTGLIRPLPADEPPAPREVLLSEVEAIVLERYQSAYRPELLRRWRAGLLRTSIGPEGPRLEETEPGRQGRRQLRRAEGSKSKKARRRLATESRRRNRRR